MLPSLAMQLHPNPTNRDSNTNVGLRGKSMRDFLSLEDAQPKPNSTRVCQRRLDDYRPLSTLYFFLA